MLRKVAGLTTNKECFTSAAMVLLPHNSGKSLAIYTSCNKIPTVSTAHGQPRL